MDRRGISPLVGAVLVVVLTLLLASMFAAAAVGMADFGTERELVADLTGGSTVEDTEDAYRSELVWARDDEANEVTSHVVNYSIAPGSDAAGNSLNSLVIEYPDGSADVASVDERAEIEMVGIDGDRDGSVEVDATADVECCPPGDGVIVSDGGNTLTIELSGNHDLEGGDALIVEYEAVENPDAGDDSVTVGVNGEVSDSGTLTIVDG
ncbi:type IV pilin [Haloplanus pelagicus]|jgi:flagellin-like protein|uniref:type IV pilin n=1 Tax=Haloplanus pelagicus TaxID=2949995 RepID=UPI002041DC37|nr:type IV pilin [Haloplanus sp. HW8-1]